MTLRCLLNPWRFSIARPSFIKFRETKKARGESGNEHRNKVITNYPRGNKNNVVKK